MGLGWCDPLLEGPRLLLVGSVCVYGRLDRKRGIAKYATASLGMGKSRDHDSNCKMTCRTLVAAQYPSERIERNKDIEELGQLSKQPNAACG
ncbi:hypothetical protein M514_06419, partial [Trichuris suis]